MTADQDYTAPPPLIADDNWPSQKELDDFYQRVLAQERLHEARVEGLRAADGIDYRREPSRDPAGDAERRAER
jgi:hypothetical protein